MSENSAQQKPLPTIWRVPDELWEIIEPILTERDPPKSTARPRVDQRAALDAIIFRIERLPVEPITPSRVPDDSSVHRTFQRWIELGVLDLIWESLIEDCEELGGVNFEWQAADGAMGKARFGGTKQAPIPPIEATMGSSAPSGRGRRRTAVGGDSRSQRTRLQAARSHAGCHRGGASRTHRGGSSTSVSGHGLR